MTPNRNNTRVAHIYARSRYKATSNRHRKTLVFVPTFNDLESVEAVIRNVPNTLPLAQNLVLDDGSTKDDGLDPEASEGLFLRPTASFGL